jgi:predicted transcriptional regulator
MQKLGVFILLIAISSNILFISASEGLEVSVRAPFFKVISGGGKVLTLDSTKGKVTVIFYETKDVLEKNRKLRNELNRSYRQLTDAQKACIVRLPIINCCNAFWPFTEIWKKGLREGSRKSRVIIYGDWNGEMLTAYGMKDNESNVVIIDKKGIIRYFKSGRVTDDEISKIRTLIENLIRE